MLHGTARALLALAALLPATARAEGELDAGERVPLAFVLNTPTGAAGKARATDLTRMIADETRRSTGLDLLTIEDQVTSGCKGRLLCVILRIRTDYERDSLKEPSGRYRPYADHLAVLKERGVKYPKLMLFITRITREGEPDRLAAQLVDTDRALEAYHQAVRLNDDWEANVEATVNEQALATPPRGEVHDDESAEHYVTELFAEHLRGPLEQAGLWEPFGTIEIRVPVANLGVSLDGVTLGITQPSGVTRIVGVKPGHREVALDGADIATTELGVDVARAQTATLEPELSARPTQGTPLSRTITMIAGGAAVAAGVVVTAIAIATPVDGASGVCFRGVQSGCETGSQFLTSGYDATRFGDQNGSGLLLAPLGYSLVGAGATWTLGTYLFTEEDEVPWIPLAAGALVGVLSYGISALANPSLYAAEPAP